jgi:hypothetical protein
LRNRITLDLRLFSNRAGQLWRVRITQNGLAIATQTAITRPTGVRPPFTRRAASLTVREVADNMQGVDRFMARATNLRTGETCTARVLVRADRQFVRPPIDRVIRPIEPPTRRVNPPIDR